MEEAQRLCDRVAIVDHGKILDLDTVDRLIEKHGGEAMIEAELTPQSARPNLADATLDGDILRLRSAKPLEAVAQLNAQGIQFRTLRIVRADLESVFLNLTGRRLRD